MTTRWWAGVLLCAVCGHRHAAVCPLAADEDEPADGQECSHCHSLSCVPIDEESR